METYRTLERESVGGKIPLPINIEELVEEREFDGSLIHFTMEQWLRSIREYREVEQLPDDAIQLTAFELPGDFGFVANPFHKCPPGCTPIMGRGLVCNETLAFQDLGKLRRRAFGTDGFDDIPGMPPDHCYYEPECFCTDLVFPKGYRLPAGTKDCGDDNCSFRFAPVRVQYPHAVVTIAAFGCVQTGGDCDRCVVEWSVSSGIYQLGCSCKC